MLRKYIEEGKMYRVTLHQKIHLYPNDRMTNKVQGRACWVEEHEIPSRHPSNAWVLSIEGDYGIAYIDGDDISAIVGITDGE